MSTYIQHCFNKQIPESILPFLTNSFEHQGIERLNSYFFRLKLFSISIYITLYPNKKGERTKYPSPPSFVAQPGLPRAVEDTEIRRRKGWLSRGYHQKQLDYPLLWVPISISSVDPIFSHRENNPRHIPYFSYFYASGKSDYTAVGLFFVL